MTLSIIAAMTEDRVIGRNNKLPWHISEDLKRFKSITMGHPIIMGRRTFESIGRALPGRRNIVISATPGFSAPAAVTIAPSLDAALALCPVGEGERFVIGGARVFAEALDRADKLYLTFVHGKFEGDVRFPQFDLRRDFKVIENIPGRSAPPDPLSYSFVTAVRVPKPPN
jgi:dihydrofolate reductase